MMEEFVDKKIVDGSMLMTLKGSVLMIAGFDGKDPKVTGAVSATIWNYVSDAATKNPDIGDLQTVVFDCDDGLLALTVATACFACLYSASKSDPAALTSRLSALKTRLNDVPGMHDPVDR